MNYLKPLSLALAFVCCMMTAGAQEKIPLNEPDTNRPLLFADLPQTIPVSAADLDLLLGAPFAKGSDITLKSSDRTLSAFQGQIIAAVTRNENNMRSVLIRSNDRTGATFSLSSSTNPDGTVSYRGRIVSFKHGDAYELQQVGEGYVLVKKNFYQLVSE